MLEGGNWTDLKPLLPQTLSYVLSFLLVGIYWGNHHHLIHTVVRVSPARELPSCCTYQPGEWSFWLERIKAIWF
ncbi:TMEM175 family protein [Spirosoma migulaei]